jgi:hypothetical protein
MQSTCKPLLQTQVVLGFTRSPEESEGIGQDQEDDRTLNVIARVAPIVFFILIIIISDGKTENLLKLKVGND